MSMKNPLLLQLQLKIYGLLLNHLICKVAQVYIYFQVLKEILCWI